MWSMNSYLFSIYMEIQLARLLHLLNDISFSKVNAYTFSWCKYNIFVWQLWIKVIVDPSLLNARSSNQWLRQSHLKQDNDIKISKVHQWTTSSPPWAHERTYRSMGFLKLILKLCKIKKINSEYSSYSIDLSIYSYV